MDGYSEGYINSLTNKMLRTQCRANGIVIWYYDANRVMCQITSAQMRAVLLALRGKIAPQGPYGPMAPRPDVIAEQFPAGTPRNVFTGLLMPVPPVQHPRGRVYRNE